MACPITPSVIIFSWHHFHFISLSAFSIYKTPYLTGKFPSCSFWTSCQVSPYYVYTHFNIKCFGLPVSFLSQCDFRRTAKFRQITHSRTDSALTTEQDKITGTGTSGKPRSDNLAQLSPISHIEQDIKMNKAQLYGIRFIISISKINHS
jgi:hypothetical protein